MNLRRLGYFVVLAQELHFGRAAAKLNLAQPALTQNLRQLEEELGVLLLARSSRRVELTEAGRILQREAQRLLSQAEAVRQKMRQLADGTAGTLRLSYARSAPGGRSSAIVDAFRAAHPAVRMEINSQFTARSVEDLARGQLDAAFVRTPITADGTPVPGLSELLIGTEPLVVGLPHGHPLTSRVQLRRADLADVPVVTGTPQRAPGFYRTMFQQIWAAAGPRVVLEEPDEEHMLRAVAAGTGITIVTRSRAALLQMEGVVFRQFEAPEPYATLALAWMAGNPSPVLAAFVEAARAAPPPPAGESAIGEDYRLDIPRQP